MLGISGQDLGLHGAPSKCPASHWAGVPGPNGTPTVWAGQKESGAVLEVAGLFHPAIQSGRLMLVVVLRNLSGRETWIPLRSAKEIAFLCQMIFCAVATLSWRFLDRPHTDPAFRLVSTL